MKLSKRFFALALAGVMVLALAACGGNGGNSTPPSQSPAPTPDAGSSTPAAPVEQVLKYGTDTWPAGFDPHTISAIAATRVFNQVYESLISFNPDMTFQGVLAESWETPDDTTYIFHLRKGVKFHNGREMTAEDVEYSFNRILGKTDAGDIGALGSSASYYGGIDTIEVVDPATIKFTLKAPNAAFMSSLTSSYGAIVPKEVVEQNNGSLASIETMCGTGPFVYKDSVVDNYITLEKNADYWEAGSPKLDGITYYLMADESTRLAALRTGDINLCSLSALNLSEVQNDSSVKVLSYQSNNYTYLGFNLSSKKLQDKNVRQAMSLAVDRDAIIDYVYNGEATVSTFVAPAMGHWVWDAPKESPLYKKNIDEAKKLMEAAGYSDSNRMTLTVAAGLLDSIRDTVVILQQQLKEIYIDVEISNLESGEYVDIWGKMDTPEAGFDAMCGQNGSGTDPNRAVSFFFSSTGNANVWGYKNDKVDELCAQGVATTDESQRETYYLEAQQIVIDECPNLFFASPMEYFFVSAGLEGFAPYAANANNFNSITLK
ncbi:MAG: ABC transporter substrate-binding protein [Angelakisella sp.]|jgi:peptide/nickel transport system substrate-binding protein|nr:ABC transporter substrate-binding protein [Angelakisella sp.]